MTQAHHTSDSILLDADNDSAFPMYHLDSSSEESLSDIDSILCDKLTTSHQSNKSEDSFSINVFDDTTNTIGQIPNALDGTTNTSGVSGIVFDDTTNQNSESCYSSFSTSQKCVTSLIYLLDSMECPDYAFRAIMEWAHDSYAAGFDFNPKCKSRSGNFKVDVWIHSQCQTYVAPSDSN